MVILAALGCNLDSVGCFNNQPWKLGSVLNNERGTNEKKTFPALVLPGLQFSIRPITRGSRFARSYPDSQKIRLYIAPHRFLRPLARGS